MTKAEEETFKKELLSAMSGIKENPNNDPIIKKHNNRIFQKNKSKAFEIIEQAVEEQIQDMFESCLTDLLDKKERKEKI